MKKQKLPVEVTLNGSSSFILLVNKTKMEKSRFLYGGTSVYEDLVINNLKIGNIRGQ